MYYLIYVSSAVKLMSDDELVALLEQSREKNLGLGITGMLLYKSGNFMQMLEGEKDVVMGLYETIRHDVRHRNVINIIGDVIMRRNFEYWSMGFYNMDKLDGLPTFNEYIDQNLTSRIFQADTKFAYKFMVSFNRNNT
jgi:hypothetical protein